MQPLGDDWLDLLDALLSSGARFLLVGAHAMAVHGVPRGTQDLDVWIDRDSLNVEKVWQALQAFGAPVSALGVTRADLAQADLVIQLGVPPNRIDILTSLSGLSGFEDAWASRVEQALGKRTVPVIGREALLVNKHAAGRAKDLADIEALGGGPAVNL